MAFNPIPYLTPYTQPDFSPIQRGLAAIQEMRVRKAQMAQQQAQFEAAQAADLERAAAQNALARGKMALDQAQFEAREGREADQFNRRLAFDESNQADAVLKDLGAAARNADTAGVESMRPRLLNRGLTLDNEMSAPQQEQPATLPPLRGLPPSMQLRAPSMGVSDAAMPHKPALTGMPMQLRMPDPGPAPQPQAEPAQQPHPTGRVRVLRGGQDMGVVDLGGIMDQVKGGGEGAARVWEGGPQSDGEIRDAQARAVEQLIRGGMSPADAIKQASTEARDILGRRDAGRRAEQMSGRADANQARLAQKDETGYYERFLTAARRDHKLPALIEAESAAQQAIALADSANPVEQRAAIARTIKSMTSGAISDYDNRFVMSAQSLSDELLVELGRLTGDTGQSKAFMAKFRQMGEGIYHRTRERRERSAVDVANTIMRATRHFPDPKVRAEYARQAMGDFLETTPQVAHAARSGGASSSDYTMEDGSDPPNLGVTSGKVPRFDVNAEADDLLED